MRKLLAIIVCCFSFLVLNCYAETSKFVTAAIPPVELEDAIVIHEKDTESVERAIKLAASEQGWDILATASGVMSLQFRYPKRISKHVLVMNVYYTPTSIRLRYVTSKNLKVQYGCYARKDGDAFPTYYSVCGHAKVNIWVDQLRHLKYQESVFL